MKPFIIIFTLFISLFCQAQNNNQLPKNYQEAIDKGKSELNKQSYNKAIDLFLAAQAFDPTERDSVRYYLNDAFTRINKLKNQAEKAKNKILIYLKKIEEQKLVVEKAQRKTLLALKGSDSINEKKQKIIDAFYFYDNKFALAYKDGKYGFIDKNGNVKIDYDYVNATPFNTHTGLAKVEDDWDSFFIDTTGYKYKLAKSIRALEVIKYNNEVNNSNNFFEALELNNDDFDDTIPRIVFENQKLKILTLRNYYNINKKSIQQIGKLDSLTHLDLYYSLIIPELPSEIGKLSKLKYLNISSNKLKNIPNEIGKLHNLEYLNISENKLKSIPTDIGLIQKMKYLDLSENDLKYLPKEIGNLKNLEYLNLLGNNLTHLPKEIGNLKNLKYLNLERNKLKSIPDEMGQLTNLKELYLENNKLEYIPKELGLLKKINKITLSENELSDIPKEIVHLFKNNYYIYKKDTTYFLDLSSNKLAKLPNNISQLSKLKRIFLSYNNFETFPNILCSLNKLEVIYIGDNCIDSIPKEIQNLRKLRVFDIGNIYHHNCNSLGGLYIPNEIGNLQNLELLDLAQKGIVAIPYSIKDLENLKNLNLGSNFLHNFPNGILNLKKLKLLNIDYNIVTLDIPQSIINSNIDFTKWDDNDALFQVAQHYFDAGNYNKSIGLYNLIIEKGRDSYNSNLFIEYAKKRIGDCYCKLNEYTKGNIYYQEAFITSKKRADTNKLFSYWFYPAWFSLFANKPQETISASLKSLELEPRFSSVYSILAIGYALNNEIEKAKSIILKHKHKFQPVARKLYDVDIENLLTALKSANIWSKGLNDLKTFIESTKHNNVYKSLGKW